MAKSGLYQRTFSYGTWKVRLDVDGNHPQNKASITLANYDAHWACDMAPVAGQSDTWSGAYFYRSAGASTLLINSRKPATFKIQWDQDATIGVFVNLYLYDSDGGQIVAFGMYHESAHFHVAEVELDYESGVDVNAAKSVTVGGVTHTLENVYQNAGMSITVSASGNSVGSASAGLDAAWSTAELNDAMTNHWSRENGAPWAMWTFFAKKSTEDGLLGRMFDSSDANQRQGVAIFVDAHQGILRQDEYLFQTVVHEVGHAFNLAHSWLKTIDPWCAGIVDEPTCASFMNYPWRYSEAKYFSSDYRKFFDDFEYRFSDQELAFLRHAPGNLVEMGQAAFHTDHGSIAAGSSSLSDTGLRLEVRVNRERPVFEFMEPVNVELKLSNTGATPVSINSRILDDIHQMTFWVGRNGGAAKRYAPYSAPCLKDENVELAAGESLYGSVFLSAGASGWMIDEPGRYRVTVALGVSEAQVLSSNELIIDVLVPDRAVQEEKQRLAQDFFNHGVGRTLAFGGSKSQKKANDTLRELAERYPTARVTRHAQIAANLPSASSYKLLDFDSTGRGQIAEHKADRTATAAVKKALITESDAALDTLGHIAARRYMDRFADKLARNGDKRSAAAAQREFVNAMERRGASVPGAVKAAIEKKAKSYGS